MKAGWVSVGVRVSIGAAVAVGLWIGGVVGVEALVSPAGGDPPSAVAVGIGTAAGVASPAQAGVASPAPTSVPSPTPTGVPTGSVAVLGGWLFDGTGDERIRNPGVVVIDGTITRIGVEGPGALPPEMRVLELDEEDTLLPGFFDLHAHYAVDLEGSGRVDDTAVYPGVFLANGVTSTFPAGEVDPYGMRELRLRIEAGEQVGPRLYNSGPYYGSWRAGWDRGMTADSIRAEVDYWVERGTHGFKAKGISPGHLQALIEAAHAHGRTVTGHLDSGARGSVNPRDAIEMGIDRVEHFAGGDAMPPTRSAYASLVEMTPEMPEFREQVQRFIDHGVFFNATLTAYGYFGEQDPEFFDYFWPEMELLAPTVREGVEARLPRRVNAQFEQIFRVKMGLLERFYELGGGHLITLGTDHPSWGQFFSGFGVHREMHAMVAAGLPEAAVLRIATINGARAMGVDDRLGTIEVGKLGDMVVVRGNPVEEIRATRNPPRVILGGVVHDAPAILESLRGRLGAASGDLRSLVPRLMRELDVPGVSIAIVRDFEVAETLQFGVMTAGGEDRVEPGTVFEAASMSKPVYAYAFLGLVEEGVMDLDTPLVDYLGRDYIEGAPLHRQITARMVLTHTTGFPNWRRDDDLTVSFVPGSEIGYSGEGFQFLQTVVEHVTGMSTEAFAQERLFRPLGLRSTSYVWQPAYEETYATGHTASGEPRERRIYENPNSAYTLYTTPEEFARILIEVMRPDRSAAHSLPAGGVRAMLSPNVHAEGRSPIQRGGSAEGEVHYGLGWRIDRLPSGDRFYHSGSNSTGFQCYSEFDPSTGQGIVIMTNSSSGSALWRAVMNETGSP